MFSRPPAITAVAAIAATRRSRHLRPRPQMKQRERVAHAVGLRTADYFEAVMQIEADRLRVLLVHIEPATAEVFHRVIRKRGADSSPRPA